MHVWGSLEKAYAVALLIGRLVAAVAAAGGEEAPGMAADDEAADRQARLAEIQQEVHSRSIPCPLPVRHSR